MLGQLIHRHRKISLIFAAALVLSACGAGLKVYAIKSLSFPNQHGVLHNGLKVVVQPDPDFPEAYVGVHYRVGAAFDPEGKRGLAHLVEHLAFRVGDELIEEEAVVADATALATEPAKSEKTDTKAQKKKSRKVTRLQADNAHTSLDETYYWYKVSPVDLHALLKDVAQTMGDFSSELSDEIIATEKEVVRNERRSRYEADPLDRAWLDIANEFYPKEHPYQGPGGIGTHEGVASITKEDIGKFLKQHYHPGNATLVISGDVDREKTLQWVAEIFGKKEKKEPSVLNVPEHWQAAQSYKEIIVPKAEHAMVTVLWPAPNPDTKEGDAMRIGAHYGWYDYRLATQRDIAYWASPYYAQWHRQGAYYAVQALLKDPADADDAVAWIKDIADSISANIGPDNIARTRRRVIYNTLYDLEYAGDRAEDMSRNYNLGGHPEPWVAHFDRLRSVGLMDVKKVMRETLQADKAMVLIHTPIPIAEAKKKSQRSTAKASREKPSDDGPSNSLDHDSRDLPPPYYDFAQSYESYRDWGQEGASRYLKTQTITLNNGIRVLYDQRGSVPLTYVHMLFGGGEILDPVGQEGLASLAFISAGTEGAAHQENGYRIGMQSSVTSSDESMAINHRFLSFYPKKGLEYAVQKLKSPEFSGKSVRRLIESKKRTYADADSRVGYLAGRAYWYMRGENRRFRSPTVQSIDALDFDKIRSFYDRVVYPENTLVAVVSSLPLETMRPHLEATLGTWKPAQKSAIDVADKESTADTTTLPSSVMVKTTEGKQTQIYWAFDAPGKDDWQGNRLASEVGVLLDDYVSKLRHAMGITYGTDISVRAGRKTGALVISTKVDNDKVEEAVVQIHKAIERIRQESFDAGKLELVKRRLLDDGVGCITVECRAHRLGYLEFSGRGVDFYSKVNTWADALTLEDLQKAKDKLFANAGTLVLAGQKAELLASKGGIWAELAKNSRSFSPDELLAGK